MVVLYSRFYARINFLSGYAWSSLLLMIEVFNNELLFKNEQFDIKHEL
jgi:hypothetical protein